MKMRLYRMTILVLSVCAIAARVLNTSFAQSSIANSVMLVTPFGPGAIPLPVDSDWKPELLAVYDDGRRPLAQYTKGPGIAVSFILFENLSGNPTAQGCREDALAPILQKDAKLISKRTDGEIKTAGGQSLAISSYLLDMGMADARQANLFGFAGDAKTCAEMHISGISGGAAEQDVMKSLLAAFAPNVAYQPNAIDYFRIGSILFKNTPKLAVPYYQASLRAMPNDAKLSTPRRVVTDQLVMSLGMSGDTKGARVVAEKAIIADPDYPLNYYNLACADAEEGNAAQAKIHLRQAFDRRANVIQGETMPDPTQDDSILKLKNNPSFWAFVQSLPRK